MPRPTASKSTSPTPRGSRYRGWSVVSNALTSKHIREFTESHPTIKAIGGIHDRDPGTATHGHLFFYDSKTPRAEQTVARMFSVPVVMKPFLVHPGEGGPHSGKHGMARAARYMTHEHPDQQALGKARYGDDEQIATPNWNWRADVNALNAYERIDPEKPARTTLLERVSKRVLEGDISTRDVLRLHSKLYLSKSQSYWDQLERRASQWAEQDARAENQARIEAMFGHEVREQVPQSADCAEQEDLAAQVEIKEQEHARLTAEQTRLAEVAAARQDAQQAYEESPEGQAEAAEQAAAERRRNMLDFLALYLEIVGPPAEREDRVLARMAEEVDDDNKPFTDLDNFFCDVLWCEPDEIDGQLKRYHKDLSEVPHKVTVAEFHAADGDERAFEQALRLREQYAAYSDLVALPKVRGDIETKWRRKLLNVGRTKPERVAA